MKKVTLAISFFFIVSVAVSFAQIGVGIGSHGLSLKTNPDAKTGLIFRTGFGLDINPIQTYIRPQVAWVKRHHYSEKTKLYAGIGANGELKMGIHELAMGYGMIIPIGLELFPLDSKKLSVSLEAGLNFLASGYRDTLFGNYGLIEICFYLTHHEETY